MKNVVLVLMNVKYAKMISHVMNAINLFIYLMIMIVVLKIVDIVMLKIIPLLMSGDVQIAKKIMMLRNII